MSTLQEIEAAIPKLTPNEIMRLQAWLDDYCEDHLELTDEVKAALDEARREIEQGRYQTRQPA
jgi:DNA replication protein DnaD